MLPIGWDLENESSILFVEVSIGYPEPIPYDYYHNKPGFAHTRDTIDITDLVSGREVIREYFILSIDGSYNNIRDTIQIKP